jgi:hypothetical protein
MRNALLLYMSPKIYSQDLLNLIFRHPYTKIEYVQKEIGVTRLTATKYLEQLCREGFLRKQKLGRTNFYINDELFSLLSNVGTETYRGSAFAPLWLVFLRSLESNVCQPAPQSSVARSSSIFPSTMSASSSARYLSSAARKAELLTLALFPMASFLPR